VNVAEKVSIPGKRNFSRGVHPDDKKSLSAHAPIEVLPTPGNVLIPLSQHIGAPCKNIVKPRTQVGIGDLIGDSDAFVSAPVHASIAGTTAAETATTLPNGLHIAAVPITASDDQPLTGKSLWDDIYGGEWQLGPIDSYKPDEIINTVRRAGIAGMGGATFPTHVKLKQNPDRPVDTLLVNGCECEPYLTSDYRLMLQAPDAIVSGAILAARAAGARRILIVIEDNKPDAISTMQSATRDTDVGVVEVHTKYPMGGERQLIYAVLKREVPTGGLPLDVGIVVVNVATAAAIARAVLRGKPLTHRIISVTGEGVRSPKNLLVPLGTSYADLIDYCGGLTDDAVRVISGGPMMGFTVADLNTPVTKGTSGVVVLTDKQVRRMEETACIRCGRCVESCPLGLIPTKIALAARAKDWVVARRYYLTACVECGCCGYVCPAGIPLVQLIRAGKAAMPKE